MLNTKHGFSLVELSIVLVILGLLTGGILSGQSLIRASELRTVSSQYNQYVTAIQTFRDKYFAVPGDFKDATRFWDRLSASAWCVSNAGKAGPVSTGTCDGDGDTNLADAAAVSQTGEKYQFWRQLSLAGLIEGSYTGLATASSTTGTLIGSNVPAGKLSASGWWATDVGVATSFAVSYAHGLTELPQNGTALGGSNLKPEEAWNIDTKIDDGKPAYGKVLSRYATGGCAIPDDGTAAATTKLASSYDVSNSSTVCSIHFVGVW